MPLRRDPGVTHTAGEPLRVLLQRDCLGGERIVEVELARPLTLTDLDRVAGVETRIVLENLPRPFFKLDVPGRYLLTGILSDRRLRVTVRLALREAATDVALDVARRMQA